MTRYFRFLGGYEPEVEPYRQLSLDFGWTWGWTTITQINRPTNDGSVRTYSLHRYEMSFFDFIRQHDRNEIHIYSIRFNGGVLYAHDRYENPPFDPNHEIVTISAIVI